MLTWLISVPIEILTLLRGEKRQAYDPEEAQGYSIRIKRSARDSWETINADMGNFASHHISLRGPDKPRLQLICTPDGTTTIFWPSPFWIFTCQKSVAQAQECLQPPESFGFPDANQSS